MATFVDVIVQGTNRLGGPLAAASKEMSAFGKVSTSAGAAVAGAAVAAAAAVGGIVAIIRSAAAAVEPLGNMAAAIGLSVEEFTRLRYAMDRAGIEAENVGTILTQMNKRIGDAASGNDGLAKSFVALGLSVGELSRMDAAQQFEAIVTALGNVENQSQRTNLAFDLFGKQAAGVLHIVDEGTESFAAMRARADELGATVSGETLAAAKSLNDAFLDLKSAIDGIKNAMLEAFGPTLTQAITALADKIASFRDEAAVLFKVIADGILATVEAARSGKGELGDFFDLLKVGGKAALVIIEAFLLGIDVIVSSFREAIADIVAGWRVFTGLFKGELRSFKEEFESAMGDSDLVSGKTPFFDDLLEKLERPDGLPGKIKKFFDDSTAEAKRAGAEIAASMTQPLRAAGTGGGGATPMEPIRGLGLPFLVTEPEPPMGPLTRGESENLLAEPLRQFPVEQGAAMDPIIENMEMIREETERNIEAFENLERAFNEMGETVEDVFVERIRNNLMSALEGVGNMMGQVAIGARAFGESMKQIFKSMVSSLIAELVKLIAKLIAVSVLQSLAGLGGANVGRAMAVARFLGLINAEGNIGTRQHGGPVQRGKPFMVGEAGPELFVPGESGRVVPNSAMGPTASLHAGNTNVSMSDIRSFSTDNKFVTLNISIGSVFGGRSEQLAIARQIGGALIELGLVRGGAMA